MELLAVKCPSCTGITEIDSSSAQGFCQYCGAILEMPKVEKARPVLTVEDIKQIEEQYFNDAQQFSTVLLAYNEAALAQGSNVDFWLARARFYATGSLKEFEAGRIPSDQREAVVGQYVLWMEEAIAEYTTHIGNATRLKMEKEKTIGDINNAFEGNKKREATPEKTLENLEDQRQEEAMDEAELAVEEMEEAAAKKKKRNIIIIAVSAVMLLLFALLLRSCGNGTPDEDVTYYEEFLELSHVLDLLNTDATRLDVLDLNIDFGDQSDEAETLSVSAPESAELDAIAFQFDEDDTLITVVVTNANYFNGFAASEGLTEEIAQTFDADEYELDGNTLSFYLDEFTVILTLRAEQFNINVSRLVDELTAEQREIWDLIEERIEEGYDTWSELTAWAYENDIQFVIYEDDERPTEAMRSLIETYGILGDYTNAAPGLGSIDDPDEVVMTLHFENLTYNDTIAELYNLNRNSGRELTTWLEGSGQTRLEIHFEEVEIVAFDEDGEQLTEMPEVVEFVEWGIDVLDLFMPEGEGSIRIVRIYRVLEVEIPEDADDDEDDDDEDADDDEDTAMVASGPTALSSGTWVVGTDIPQGRYVITAGNSGNIIVRRGTDLLVNEILGGGTDFGVSSVTTYLLNGDEIEIVGINSVNFNPVANRTLSNTLSTGHWVVGVDIPAGQFDATTPSGAGNLIIWRGRTLRVNEILGDGSFGEERVRVNLADGDIITISGLDQVNFE